MAVVQIKVGGVDLTSKIVFGKSRFVSAVNGAVGEADILVDDEDRSITPVTGAALELIVDDEPVWTGYVVSYDRTYVFPALNVTDFGLARFFRLRGVDLNILFLRRYVFNQSTPENPLGTLFPPGTADTTAIEDLIANFLDLSGDGLDTSTFVENVGDINVDQDARAWAGGDTWQRAMSSIASLPAAVYFLAPTRDLVYTDANTQTADKALTDQPGSTQAATDGFGTDSTDGWFGWTYDFGTASFASVSGGEAHGVIPYPAGAIGQYRDLLDVSGSIHWSILTRFRINAETAYVDPSYGLFIGNFGIDIEVFGDLDTDELIVNYAAYTTDEGNFSDDFPWDADYRFAEFLVVDGVAEVRVWKDGDPRPSTPDITAIAATPVAPSAPPYLNSIYSQLIMGSTGGGSGNGIFDIDYITVTRYDAEVAGAGYREMTIINDGTGLANDVLAWGVGYGSDEPVFVRDDDATSLAEHGRWQAGITRPGVYKQATIDRIASSIVDGSPESQRGAKDNKVAVEVVTFESGFLPAQKVDFTSTVFGFNDIIPIRRMTVTFEAPDTPKYTLILSHDIDAPFGFFDPFLLKFPRLILPQLDGWISLPPVMLFYVECYPNIAPPDDGPGWGPDWSGSDTGFAEDASDVPQSPTPLPVRSIVDLAIRWNWANYVTSSPSGSPGIIDTGAKSIWLRSQSVPSPKDNIHATYYIVSTSDESGDIADAVINDSVFANQTGSMEWSTMLAIHPAGSPGGTFFGLKIANWTGTSNHIAGVYSWNDNHEDDIGLPVTQGPGSLVAVGLMGPVGWSPSAQDAAPALFNGIAGTLTIDGDPTQLTITFVNDADMVTVSETILAADYGGPFAYTDGLEVAMLAGQRGSYANGFNSGILGYRRTVHGYAFSIDRTALKLWDDGDPEPPDGMVCGPVYSTTFIPQVSLFGLGRIEVPTKLSATEYATSFAILPGSLQVKISGLLQRPGVDFTQTDANKFEFTSPVDPTETVWVKYQTGGAVA